MEHAQTGHIQSSNDYGGDGYNYGSAEVDGDDDDDDDDDGVDGDDDCDGDGGRVGLGKVIGSPPSATAV